MGIITTVHDKEKPIYDISLETGFDHFANVCETLKIKERKVCLVTDSNVANYHKETLLKFLNDRCHCKTVNEFVFLAGEENKQLDSIKQLYAYLIEEKFDRNDYLFALGGGVIGDMTGFAAATFLRGISFVQIPTSLLAMADSSIGGKTGVDFDSYKNMVGAFHQPKAVYINVRLLDTLPEREFYSGFGEIIKHGLIRDREYYLWLKENAEKIFLKDQEILKEMIYRNNEVKRHIVENDQKEQGERVLLNFGHTLGHSIEKFLHFRLLHGECVSLGMVGAAFISAERGLLSKEELQDMKMALKLYHLPVFYQGLDVEKVLEYMKNDKKMIAGKVKFILLDGIGNAVIDKTVTEEEMKQAIQYLSIED